jgi:maleate isomerase
MAWQDDGWDARWRIAILTPHADVGPESEFRAMAPAGVSVHATRVPFAAMAPGGAMAPTIAEDAARAFADPPHVDDAIALLAASPLHAIAYAFTSSSYLRGAEDDLLLKQRLESRARDIPVVIPCLASVRALRALGAQTLALVDPPWFSASLNAHGAEYFRRQGFNVAFSAPAGMPSGQSLVKPDALFDWMLRNVPKSVDAVFVGGNGFRSVGIISAFEEAIGRPMLTANQVALWECLQVISCDVPVRDYGQLFNARAA